MLQAGIFYIPQCGAQFTLRPIHKVGTTRVRLGPNHSKIIDPRTIKSNFIGRSNDP